MSPVRNARKYPKVSIMLKHSSLPYRIVHDADMRSGDLEHVDVLLTGNSAETYPETYAGGLGHQGTSLRLMWVTEGRHFVAIAGALRAVAGPLGLPIRFPLASIPGNLLAIPGSIVTIVPETAHPLMLGIDEPFPAMMQGTIAVGARRRHDGTPLPDAFGPAGPLLSGWMRGEDLLTGLGAVLDYALGLGRVVGFAFRPHLRTQILASYAPPINAIVRAGQHTIEGENR